MSGGVNGDAMYVHVRLMDVHIVSAWLPLPSNTAQG